MTAAARQLVLRGLLCELLRQHASELRLDVSTIATPRPGAVVARDEAGASIVSIDFADFGLNR